MNWEQLNPGLASRLAEARMQAHYAAQCVPRFGRAYLNHRPDDSHTAMQRSDEWDALMSEPAGPAGRWFRLGVRLRDLSLLLTSPAERYPLDGRTAEEAIVWLQGQVERRGLDPQALAKPLHYTIPDHQLARGARFEVDSQRAAFWELSRYFRNAARLLEEIRAGEPGASSVRCWPHHFDIAILWDLGGGRSIGAGLSPGDQSYPQPYFYVTPWPYPDARNLPALAFGRWHTAGWIGAVLTADEMAGAGLSQAQANLARQFVRSAVAACRGLLGSG